MQLSSTSMMLLLSSATTKVRAFSDISSITLSSIQFRIDSCNSKTSSSTNTKFVDFVVDDTIIGHLNPALAAHLSSRFSYVFQSNPKSNSFTINPSIPPTCEDRTNAIRPILRKLREENVISGWRDEDLAVVTSFDDFNDNPLFLLERAAMPHFGCRSYGVHMNGFIEDPSTGKPSHLWVGRRSATKQTSPGMLDHLVAGGQPFGITPFENMVKECAEEASIPEKIAKNVVCGGFVSYKYHTAGQVKQDTLFCYDLKVPLDFVPTPCDGEVDSFTLMSIDDVMAHFANDHPDPFKPNCCLVIIDFLVRKGILSAGMKGYERIITSLKQ